MIFASWAIGTFIPYLVLAAIRLLRRKKHTKEERDVLLKSDGFRLLVSLGIGLVLACFMLLFPRISLWNAAWMFSIVSLLVMFFRPEAFLPKKQKGPDEEKKALFSKRQIVSMALMTGLLLETFAFNPKAYVRSDSETISSIATDSRVMGNYTVEENGDITLSNGQVIYFLCDEENAPKTLTFEFASHEAVPLRVTVSCLFDNGTTYDVAAYDVTPNYANTATFRLYSVYDGVAGFRFTVNFVDARYGNPPTEVRISSFLLNAPQEFHFSYLRYAAFASIVLLCFYFQKFLTMGKEEKEKHGVPYLILGGLASALLISLVATELSLPSSFMTAYPIEEAELHQHLSKVTGKTDIYVSLFDAFRKGRLDLDLDVDPKLLALENPWDPTTRNNSGAYYYWDHAFYNGKYYSYYGPFPVFAVSFPLYWLSGCRYVPTAFGLEVIGMGLLLPAFWLLLMEIFYSTQEKVNWIEYGIFGVLGSLTAMMVSSLTFKDGSFHEGIYHVPDIYGLAVFDLFFFFVLHAYRSKTHRPLTLGFAGLFFVFLVFARPNLFLGVFLALPFLLEILFEKGKLGKQRILRFVPMFAVLLVGAVLACLYNYARFDSILEFGQSYQLNVADQRYLTYSFEKLWPSFLHFYAQPGTWREGFPFLTTRGLRYDWETRSMAPYVTGYCGVLMIPLFWLNFATPAAFFKEKRKAFAIMGWIWPFFLYLFAYTTYSKAGVCPRYLIELYHLATIASFFALLEGKERLEARHQGFAPAATLEILGLTLLTCSSLFCLSLSFDGFDGMKISEMGAILARIKQALFLY